MDAPDERQMHADLRAAPFLVGQSKGRWGRVVVEPPPEWPVMLFSVAAAKRENAPDRFYLRLDCAGYPARSPTGGFWDPQTKDTLAAAKWPKGTKRVADVFKHGWRDGKALYHPFDRVTWDAHPDWPQQYKHLTWTRDHTIVDFLLMVHGLLNSSEYTGV
jgi:hypothetical protein